MCRVRVPDGNLTLLPEAQGVTVAAHVSGRASDCGRQIAIARVNRFQLPTTEISAKAQ